MKTGQTKVVAQGGGGWINTDPIISYRKDRVTHYRNSKGIATIGICDNSYTIAASGLIECTESFSSYADAEDRVYEILKS